MEDHVEAAIDDQMKKKPGSTSPQSVADFRVVALGASTGGLESLRRFFLPVSPKSGICFIVITHQQAGRESLLPELLRPCTAMPVISVTDAMPICPDKVYICPPGCRLHLQAGIFKLRPQSKESPPLGLIDDFFLSLALDCGPRAIAVVLSGMGKDGSKGIIQISERGGVVLAEDPLTATSRSMPESAINSGVVNFCLAPENMVAVLRDCGRKGYKPPQPIKSDVTVPVQRSALNTVFDILHHKSGQDFRQYKEATLLRRIERRMDMLQIASAAEYCDYLASHPEEATLLFRDLLIRVTVFFRDPGVWSVVRAKIIPRLFSMLDKGETLRIWVPGCATGEEAYSIALVLRDYMEQEGLNVRIQLFASDLDEAAVQIARRGIYSKRALEYVDPSFLKRFFTPVAGDFQVKKIVREMVVFAHQNLIKDPPFTRLHLISCRNLLIYMKPETQIRLIELFHYALNPGGFLILGTSESLGGSSALFEVLDKKSKLYERKVGNDLSSYSFILSGTGDRNHSQAPSRIPVKMISATKESFNQLVLKMLADRHAPASIVVSGLGEIYFIHGKTGGLLEMNEGRPRNNVLEMAREGLRHELAEAIHQVSRGEAGTARKLAKAKIVNSEKPIEFSVERLISPDSLSGLILITFYPEPAGSIQEKQENHAITSIASGESDETQNQAEEEPPLSEPQLRKQIAELKKELQVAQNSYQKIVGQLEGANEAQKTMNEELQSTNEELQSTNEELETSKEEMQSLNEELSTVNAELQSKVESLSRAKNDLQNLLNSTNIATIFLDEDLCVKRFTEEALRFVSLRDSDVGRPLSELAWHLDYGEFETDAGSVLRTLVPRHIEIATRSGEWFLLRISPYRTLDNVIEGLVCTFVEINALKQAEHQVTSLTDILQRIPAPFAVVDRHQVIHYSSHSWLSLLNSEPAPHKGKRLQKVMPAKLFADGLSTLVDFLTGAESHDYTSDFLTSELSGKQKLTFKIRSTCLPSVGTSDSERFIIYIDIIASGAVS